VPDQASRRSRRLSVELKYATIAVLIVATFVVLHVMGTFSGVNDTVTDGVDRLAGLGSIGIFLIALIATAAALRRARWREPPERHDPRVGVRSGRGDRRGGVVQGG